MVEASELAGWRMTGTGPEAYERYIVPAWMAEWAEVLVEAAGIGPGDRVLDVACGTGIVARKAAPLVGPGGRVTGIDSSEGMVGAAGLFAAEEGRHGIEWLHCDASHMPFKDAEFDMIMCQQGLQFFPDRPAALKEMARVLAPGGRLAISVWRSIDRCPFLAAFAEVVGDYLGASSTAILSASCSLTDREELRTLLNNAGFRDVDIRLEVRVSRYPSLADFLPGYLSVFPFAADVAAMREADRGDMFLRISHSLRDYVDDNGLAAPMECHVITATK